MLSIIFFASLIVLGIGYAAKLLLDWRETKVEITWKEYGINSAVMLCIVIPLTAWGGRELSFQNLVSYNEFWNGWEQQAVVEETTCHRDGACHHYYNCDPYTVQVPYDCSYTTGSGKNQRRVSKTCYRTETRYHHCPYTKTEYSYTVNTTLGEYLIASHWLPTNPDAHRWRSWESVPSGLPSGIPAFWQAAKDRVDANNPDPVTVRKTYSNLILASQHTILKQFSADIDRYKQEDLFPVITKDVTNTYYANRSYFVGVAVPGDWSHAVGYFNAAFGQELQGDLHLVIVDGNKVTNPDNYIGALVAHWQSPEMGKDALSKNGFVVVLATKDGKTVDWARGLTGMPEGNEALIIEIRNKLPGTALTPEAILGPPKGNIGGNTVSVVHNKGALESLVWGDNRFQRVHMKDFSYLSHEIQPTGWQTFWIYFVAVLFGCIGWGICIGVGERVNTFRANRNRGL